jgi:hypothetical protein
MLPQAVKILEIVEETRAVKTFTLDVSLPDAEPGQFIMLWLPDVDEKPISIAAPSPLMLTVARLGPFSTALHACQVGDYLGWRGPFGRPFRLFPGKLAVLVGGGYGAAPLYFLATRALADGVTAGQVVVALGARLRWIQGLCHRRRPRLPESAPGLQSPLSRHLWLWPRGYAGRPLPPGPRARAGGATQRRAIYEVWLWHLRPVCYEWSARLPGRASAHTRPTGRCARFRALSPQRDGAAYAGVGDE